VAKKLKFHNNFKKFYKNSGNWLKSKINKQIRFLLEEPTHPSLKLRRMKGSEYYLVDIDYFYRMILKIEGDVYYIVDIGPHDIERKY